MKSQNLVGMVIAFFLMLALIFNGVMQEFSRKEELGKYVEVTAKVTSSVKYGEHSRSRYRIIYDLLPKYIRYVSYVYDGNEYKGKVPNYQYKDIFPGFTTQIFIDPNNPEKICSDSSLRTEIATFGFAIVALTVGIFQIVLGTKCKYKDDQDKADSIFFAMLGTVGLLAGILISIWATDPVMANIFIMAGLILGIFFYSLSAKSSVKNARY